VKKLACIGFLAACAFAFAHVARGDAVDDYITGEIGKRRIPGVALNVIRNGAAIKTSAYGYSNLELSAPVRPDTVFEIGSISKQFTAAGILLLAQEGRLSVDDRITDHLKGAPPAWTNITLRHLLTHTSGLKNYTLLDGFELRRHLTQELFIRAIAAQPVDFPAGSAWKYSNTGFNLLGFIIENVSGTNYWDFMKSRIFGPLGMDATTDRRPRRIIPNRASGYEQTNGVLINRDYDLTDIFSAGAIVSTVLDMAKWNAALDADTLLSARTKELMWTPARLNDGKPVKYGFGWFLDSVEGHRNIGHSGATSGFSASIQRFPDDKLAVILLTNTDEQIATALAKKVATFYFTAQAAGK
jgi:D-alanyl-D-alanine carboxypeptidase